MAKRRDIRELVFKALFAAGIAGGDPYTQLVYISGDDEMADLDSGEMELSSIFDDPYTLRLMNGITANADELDGIISQYSEDWDLDRIGATEKGILRMGFYEMLFDEKLPSAIAINEAIDMTKKYGSPKAAAYVNGLLGKKADEMKNSEAGEE